MATNNAVAMALATCELHTARIEEITTAKRQRIAGAPDIDRADLIAAFDAILIDVKSLRAQLSTLRTELPIH